MSAYKKISQREARRLRKENAVLQYRLSPYSVTPGTGKTEVCNVTLDGVQAALVKGAERFGASIRWERFGNLWRLYLYRETEL